MRFQLPAVLVLLTAALACRNASILPVSPELSIDSPAAAPVASLSINGPATMALGSNVLFDATATLDNGLRIYHAAGDWETDNTSIASFKGGVLTSIAPGRTTVSVTYRGQRASVPLEVTARSSAASADSANIVITFTPNPAVSAARPCSANEPGSPSWSFFEVYNETHGVGFTQQLETVNLYADDGRLLESESHQSDYHFGAGSQFVELFDTCVSLAGAPRGTFEEILDGVDDVGRPLTFVHRLALQ